LRKLEQALVWARGRAHGVISRKKLAEGACWKNARVGPHRPWLREKPAGSGIGIGIERAVNN